MPRPPESRRASALVLVYPRPVEAHVLLTVRAATLPHHAGQVSLPGGRQAPGESAEQAALREAHEEVGLDRSRVQVLTRLSTVHIAVSRFRVAPIVALAAAPLAFRAEPREVARIVEVPVRELTDPARVGLTAWALGERDYDVPYFDLDGEIVWGATAIMLAEFVELVRP